ncbi:hypothetical protein [Helicobacter cynogastricus]|uniref:hypothetical protein n=1 Tax=Helicobacter cynogastricus TaxID=329937 RepID=UPI000CF1B020|nr:hypothetical protein [Helicobacter cynogastricus]
MTYTIEITPQIWANLARAKGQGGFQSLSLQLSKQCHLVGDKLYLVCTEHDRARIARYARYPCGGGFENRFAPLDRALS